MSGTHGPTHTTPSTSVPPPSPATGGGLDNGPTYRGVRTAIEKHLTPDQRRELADPDTTQARKDVILSEAAVKALGDPNGLVSQAEAEEYARKEARTEPQRNKERLERTTTEAPEGYKKPQHIPGLRTSELNRMSKDEAYTYETTTDTEWKKDMAWELAQRAHAVQPELVKENWVVGRAHNADYNHGPGGHHDVPSTSAITN